MGAGKTSVGRRVAELAGVAFTDLDDVVVEQRGRSIAEFFEQDGEAAFRAAESGALPEVLGRGGVVALGGGTPLHDPSWRAVKAGAVSVFLDAPLDVVLERIGDGEGRPLASRGPDVLRGLLAGRIARYREADHAVDAAPDVETVAAEVLKLWRA